MDKLFLDLYLTVFLACFTALCAFDLMSAFVEFPARSTARLVFWITDRRKSG